MVAQRDKSSYEKVSNMITLVRISTPMRLVRTWGGTLFNGRTQFVATYDQVHNIWQGSFKHKGQPTEYLSEDGFGTEDEMLLAFSRKFHMEFRLVYSDPEQA